MNNSTHQDLIQSDEDDDENGDFQLENSRGESHHFVSLLNTMISGTARLNVLLPTATILALTNFAPVITNDGHCDDLDRWLLGFFLALSSFYCVFFSFTDSFRSARGRLYYGVATFHGIWTLNGGRKKPPVPSDYRLRWSDLFHATLSLIAFLTFAATQKDVVDCYFPGIPRKVTTAVPLLVESVVGALFVMFPSGRRGIGNPLLLQKNALPNPHH